LRYLQGRSGVWFARAGEIADDFVKQLQSRCDVIDGEIRRVFSRLRRAG